MLRFAILALIALTAIASLCCQSYTTGLQKTVARADETTVVAALRSIGVAQQTYSISNGGNFGTLDQLRDGGYLDVRFNSANGGFKNYSLTLNANPQSAEAPASFTCNADPTNTGPQAGRHFYVDSTSEAIHVNADKPATATDPLY
jgi:Tfp pilus assembly protein PilE